MAYSLISIVSISAVSLQLYILTMRWNRILTRSPDSPHNPGSTFRVQNQLCIWEGCPQSTGLNRYSIRQPPNLFCTEYSHVAIFGGGNA